MKYMGSKQAMLRNGLGEVLLEHASRATGFFDVFAGSNAVAAFVGSRVPIPVWSSDLQLYSVALGRGFLEVNKDLQLRAVLSRWLRRAQRVLVSAPRPELGELTKRKVAIARSWCASQCGRITSAYGGHYFSPFQASWLDALRETLPRARGERNACLAALVEAASRCAAAPGHTAQPFQPTSSAIEFLAEAWRRDLLANVSAALDRHARHRARVPGRSLQRDCMSMLKHVTKSDLVFLDPPYSAVQYSRFYHVLETVASNYDGMVEGVGRYPPRAHRPISDFSMKTKSLAALDALFGGLAEQGATVVITFPEHECSNGLSGPAVAAAAAQHFRVLQKKVHSTFSTLGGPASSAKSGGRAARQAASELILVLSR